MAQTIAIGQIGRHGCGILNAPISGFPLDHRIFSMALERMTPICSWRVLVLQLKYSEVGRSISP